MQRLLKKQQAQEFLSRLCAHFVNYRDGSEPSYFLSLLVSGDMIYVYENSKIVHGGYVEWRILDIKVDVHLNRFGSTSRPLTRPDEIALDTDFDKLDQFLRDKLGTNQVKQAFGYEESRKRDIAKLQQELQTA